MWCLDRTCLGLMVTSTTDGQLVLGDLLSYKEAKARELQYNLAGPKVVTAYQMYFKHPTGTRW